MEICKIEPTEIGKYKFVRNFDSLDFEVEIKFGV